MEHMTETESAIEELLDRVDAEWFLACLASVCRAKAAHVLEAWQDSELASRWDVLAKEIDEAAVGTEGM